MSDTPLTVRLHFDVDVLVTDVDQINDEQLKHLTPATEIGPDARPTGEETVSLFAALVPPHAASSTSTESAPVSGVSAG